MQSIHRCFDHTMSFLARQVARSSRLAASKGRTFISGPTGNSPTATEMTPIRLVSSFGSLLFAILGVPMILMYTRDRPANVK